jgi:hypothetical protein
VFEIGDQIVHVFDADRQTANEIAPEAVSDKTAPRSSISSWPRNGRCFGATSDRGALQVFGFSPTNQLTRPE